MQPAISVTQYDMRMVPTPDPTTTSNYESNVTTCSIERLWL